MKRRLFCTLLMLTLVISTTTAGFCSSTATPYGSSNDRFDYEYVTSESKLVSTATITQKQADDLNRAIAVAEYVASQTGLLGDLTVAVTEVGRIIYDMGGPGTLKAYSKTKTKYKINVTTGNRTVVAQWKIITFKLYRESGNLYNTRTHTVKVK